MVGAVARAAGLAAQRDRAPCVRRREPRADRRRPRPEHGRDPPAGLPRPRHPAPSRLTRCASCAPARRANRLGANRPRWDRAGHVPHRPRADRPAHRRRQLPPARARHRRRPIISSAGSYRWRCSASSRTSIHASRSGGGRGVLALATGLFGVDDRRRRRLLRPRARALGRRRHRLRLDRRRARPHRPRRARPLALTPRRPLALPAPRPLRRRPSPRRGDRHRPGRRWAMSARRSGVQSCPPTTSACRTRT